MNVLKSGKGWPAEYNIHICFLESEILNRRMFTDERVWITGMRNGRSEAMHSYNAHGPGVHQEQHASPLRIASWEGHTDVVRILLEKGADPNVPDDKRGSPIQAASQWGHQHIVKLLSESGAVDVVTTSESTALE
ncbi:hypothetical protein B0H13DRAFT_1902954 [Mycena leptocephala]|nr:hypothetical protein B0H13DRAFT_1902954 [Mycena leptocephala]